MLTNKQFKLLLENIQSREEIIALLKKYNIENYIINDDGSIDVNGHVSLIGIGLTKLPFKFGKVKGDFDCAHNFLTNLIGAPQIIEGDFTCQFNELINLEGVPKFIIGGFYLFKNEWERLNPFKEQEQEKTLDNMIDKYGKDNYINVKEFLYKDNKLIKR